MVFSTMQKQRRFYSLPRLPRLLRLLSLLLLITSLVPLCSGSPVEDDVAVLKTITVDKSGHGDYKSVQEAIDSVPDFNNQWIKIHVKQGIYNEKVVVKVKKTYILLEGEGPRNTLIQWGDHVVIVPFEGKQKIVTGTMGSATFTVYASNFVARDITFRNTYNKLGKQPPSQAVAALATGDKASFYNCGFIGLQDTLYDFRGRHYFYRCWIAGAVDFIFGNARSIYEKCHIQIVPSVYQTGYITAHGRNNPRDESGFLFKRCTISGAGKAYLGRAWRPFSRVLFYRTRMTDAVVPQGWDAWTALGKEDQTTYAEIECFGPGSNTNGRVKWLKNLANKDLVGFVRNMLKDREGWRSQEPLRRRRLTVDLDLLE